MTIVYSQAVPQFDTTPLTSSPPETALQAFAETNALHYETSAPAPAYGGALFEYLENASVSDRFSGEVGGRLFDVGTVTGTVGGSQSRTTSGGVQITSSFTSTRRATHGYLVIRLDRALPHIVLDATQNDRTFGSSIPMPIAQDQRLSLEGDFDNHFRLYCPTGYERDALYVMTPDLMALLIDDAGDLDAEIVDDLFYLYSNDAFDVADPALWQRLASIRAVLGAKALSQTENYSDDRVAGRAANAVGEDGRRLRQTFIAADSSMTPRRLLFIVGGAFVLIFGVVITGFVLIWGAISP
ncbi:hypothetical protein [Agreia bicolorata]|uniref:hypothetical protein n=1 Tax=Agreia bicolorata TaxID=110935 RepID=UPI000698BA55|nr:hypothetical protein [Agreia bicolorata]